MGNVLPGKISVQLAALRLPFAAAVNAAAEVRAEGVEIDGRGELNPHTLSRTGVREVRKMLADRRLQAAAVAFMTRHGYAELEGLDRRVEATKAAMEMASQLGASLVLNAIGPLPQEDDPAAWQVLREVLQDLGRHGNRVGAILAARTGDDSGPRLARLLAELPERTLVVDFNPARLMAAGFSPLEAVAALGPWIEYVEAADLLRDEPAAPGRGEVDFPAILAALDEQNYRGWFAVGAAGTGDPRRELAEAVARFRKCAGG